MLIGVIALAVPITIHLIGRQRARVVTFAALDFLLASNHPVQCGQGIHTQYNDTPDDDLLNLIARNRNQHRYIVV